MSNLDGVKYSDIDGKFVVLNDVSASGDMYNDNGLGLLIFGITNNNIYKITLDQVSDPTQGTLVVTGDATNKKVTWVQDHDEDNSYDVANEAYAGYDTSAYYGDDLGSPILQALRYHVTGTYNIVNYDPFLVTDEDIYEGISENKNAPYVPTSVNASATSDGASVTAQ